MPEIKPCPKCNGVMYHNVGESHKINPKTGKEWGHYENWKCGSCKNTEWIDRKRPSPMVGIQKEADQGNKILNELAEIHLKLDFIITKIKDKEQKLDK